MSFFQTIANSQISIGNIEATGFAAIIVSVSIAVLIALGARKVKQVAKLLLSQNAEN